MVVPLPSLLIRYKIKIRSNKIETWLSKHFDRELKTLIEYISFHPSIIFLIWRLFEYCLYKSTARKKRGKNKVAAAQAQLKKEKTRKKQEPEYTWF
jgi:hypothetical protein